MKKPVLYCNEYDCNAESTVGIACEECLINGGLYNPKTGKKDYIRHFLLLIGVMARKYRYPKS